MRTLVTRRGFNLGLLGLLSSSLFLSSGCFKKKDSNLFTIGFLTPRTGPDAQVGLACERGARLAEAYFNKEVNYPFKIIYSDTESSPSVACVKAQKLIADGAHVLIGAHNSGVTGAIAQVCEAQKCPFVINVAGAPLLTKQGYQFVFRNFPTADCFVKKGIVLSNQLIDQIKESPPKKAGFIGINDTHGQAMEKLFEKELVSLKIPVIKRIRYDPRVQDLSSEIRQIKEAGVDFLFVVTRLNDAIILIKECVKQRYNPKAIFNLGSPGMYESQFFNVLKSHADHHFISTGWYNKKSVLTQKALDLFKNLYPHAVFDLNVAFTFESILIAHKAYEASNLSKEREAIKEALRSLYIEERVVCGGPIAFDKEGQAKNIDIILLQNQKGRALPVLPEDYQEAFPIVPKPDWFA